MATSFTLTSGRFPESTVVFANAVGARDVPVQATVTGGSAVFSGLREFHDYIAHATVDGQYRAEIFTTDGGPSSSGGVDTGTLVGSVVFDGEGWPERPDFGVVIWIGGALEDDPSADMAVNDIWFQAEE